MLAVIKTGGKQYLIKAGDILKVEKLTGGVGTQASFDALLVAAEDGSEVKVGMPTVPGSLVTAEIIEHGKGKKVSVVKYKRKVRYRRNVGHRQHFTKIKITDIA